MSRFASFVLLAVVIAFAYFAFYNPGSVTLNLWQGRPTELPVAGVALIFMAAGAMVVFFLFLVRGLRKTYDGLLQGARRRKRAKAEELYDRGVDAHLAGKTELALSLLKGALDKDPEFLFPNFRLGKVYLEQGLFDEAIDLHRAVLVKHPRNLRLLFMLVDDYVAAGRPTEAASLLKDIIGKDDSNRTALTMLRDIQEEEEEWESAVETQKRLMKNSGSPDSLAYLKGLRCQWAISLTQRGDYDRAVKILKDIIKDDPRFVPALVALGDAYLGQGRSNEGLKVLGRGYSQHQNPAFLQVMEERLLEREEPRRLVESFRSLIDSKPQDLFLNLFYAKICLRLEMIDEGFMALKRVESTGYESSLLYALLGEFDARRERYEDAAEDFHRALSLSDGFDPQFSCGVCGQASGRWEPRCWSCGSWNSFILPGLTEPKYHPAQAPQYEGEED